MSDELEDKGGVLESVVDTIADASIPEPIKKNFFKAFSQLCTAAVEVPVAYLEGVAGEKRAESEARVKIIEKSANEIAEQMEFDPEYAKAAVKKFGQKIVREQINLDRVTEKAAKQISESEIENESKNEKEINDDWLNNFEKEASQKSTEDMQLMFSRVLAGEISSPDSFSIKTVKLLGELDRSAATLFQKFCSACVALEVKSQDGNSILIDARVPSLGGNAGANSISQYGFSFAQLNILLEYGLIISDFNSYNQYDMAVLGKNKNSVIPLAHANERWLLIPQKGFKLDAEFRVSGVQLSNTGKELYAIVDKSPQPTYTQALVGYFTTQKLQMINMSEQKT